MLGDDEDVFDSVTWESPTNPYDVDEPAPSGPGFRLSTVGEEDGRAPNDPKWEGYLITSVKDPVKELAETKDAYVSYLVSAKVGEPSCILCPSNPVTRPTYLYSPPQIRHRAGVSRTLFSSETTWLKIFQLV
jgi:sorting nexin-4